MIASESQSCRLEIETVRAGVLRPALTGNTAAAAREGARVEILDALGRVLVRDTGARLVGQGSIWIRHLPPRAATLRLDLGDGTVFERGVEVAAGKDCRVEIAIP